MENLQQIVKDANQRAGRERQKVFAKKSYLKVSDASVIDMLCERAEELCSAVAKKEGMHAAMLAMGVAVKLARRQREQRR